MTPIVLQDNPSATKPLLQVEPSNLLACNKLQKVKCFAQLSKIVEGGGVKNFVFLRTHTRSQVRIIPTFYITLLFFLLIYLRMRTKKIGDPVKQDNTRVKKPLDPRILKLLEAREIPEYNRGKITQTPEEKDSVFENILEFVDLTGISSHDDARRAYESMRKRGVNLPNFNEFVDMLGAVPVIGKVGKAPKLAKGVFEVAKQSPKYMKVLNKLMGAYDSGQDIYEDNIQ